MRLVGEHNLERQQLCRLGPVEIDMDIVDRHVEVGKLDFMAHFAHAVEAIFVCRQVEPTGHIDFVVAHRKEEVDVEKEHLEQRCDGKNRHEAGQRLLEQPVARVENIACLPCYFPSDRHAEIIAS